MVPSDEEDDNDMILIRERCTKKKLTNVSFMYVCVAENGEMLVFFLFSPTIV